MARSGTMSSVGISLVVALGVATASASRPITAPRAPDRVIALADGQWLGPSGFQRATRYIVGGRIRTSADRRADTTIELAGRFVVPPFGEAHNHNVEFTTPSRTDSVIRSYLRDGVFYVMNPAIVPRSRAAVASRVNVPTGVDVVFSNGVLTATGGHPIGLYRRNLGRGVMAESDGEGAFFWTIDSLADLNAKWPRILEGRPDFIKIILQFSEEYAKRARDTAYFNWKGIDPALVPEIVRRAHAAGLRVAAHIESSTDFHNVVAGGVDIVAHMPGFRGDERTQMPDPSRFAIAPADARLAARQGIIVVTTLGGIVGAPVDSELRARFDSNAARNLRTLREAGVRVAIGSDNYRGDSSEEVRYLATLGVFDPLALLRLWSEATPSAIFPSRKVGCLADGCEASLLVLGADPRAGVDGWRDIRLRVKDGAILSF